MGYDLHITRKAQWFDPTGPAIAEAEWRSLIDADPELTLDTSARLKMSDGEYIFAAWNDQPAVLGYYNGEITSKNPDKPLVAKMVRIATALNAQAQGDDGEIYREDGTSFEPDVPSYTPKSPGILDRIKAIFRRRSATDPPYDGPIFRVGQRVKNPWGVKGVVIHVNPKANGGLGTVIVRMDDGNEHNMAYKASGLTIISEPGASS